MPKLDDDQPGPNLDARWYLRSAEILSKLENVAHPGNRILVVYGSGHGYWLRHFATTTPSYRLVDMLPYLRRAAGAARWSLAGFMVQPPRFQTKEKR